MTARNDNEVTLEDIVQNISEDEIRQVRTFDQALTLANVELIDWVASGDLVPVSDAMTVRDQLAEEIWKRSPARQP